MDKDNNSTTKDYLKEANNKSGDGFTMKDSESKDFILEDIDGKEINPKDINSYEEETGFELRDLPPDEAQLSQVTNALLEKKSNKDKTSYKNDDEYIDLNDFEGNPEVMDDVPKEKRYEITKTAIAFIIIVCLLLSTALSFGMFTYLNRNNNNSNVGSITKDGYTLEKATGSKMTVSQIVEKNKAAVVEIRTESVSQDNWLRQYVQQGAGSGVIIKEDGYIVTNSHVVKGSSKVYVTLSNGKEYPAKIIGYDETNDIAVIKIVASNLTVATYGNSNQVKVGDLSVVVGNPLGELGGSVTAGIVSSLDRNVTIDNKTMSLMQTDASVNPGNSGGAMFNDNGQLIGLIVAKSGGSDVEGIGFAIPVNKVAETADKIMKNGSTKTEEAASETAYSGMVYALGRDGNVYIESILSDTAKSSELKEGDMVYSINNKEVTDLNTLKSIITSYKPGDTVTYTISRDGKSMKVKLTLGSKPDQA